MRRHANTCHVKCSDFHLPCVGFRIYIGYLGHISSYFPMFIIQNITNSEIPSIVVETPHKLRSLLPPEGSMQDPPAGVTLARFGCESFGPGSTLIAGYGSTRIWIHLDTKESSPAWNTTIFQFCWCLQPLNCDPYPTTIKQLYQNNCALNPKLLWGRSK